MSGDAGYALPAESYGCLCERTVRRPVIGDPPLPPLTGLSLTHMSGRGGGSARGAQWRGPHESRVLSRVR